MGQHHSMEFLDAQLREIAQDLQSHQDAVVALRTEAGDYDKACVALLAWGLKARKRYPTLIARGRVALTMQDITRWVQQDLRDFDDASTFQVEARLVRASAGSEGAPGKEAWISRTKPASMSTRWGTMQSELAGFYGRHRTANEALPSGAALLEAAELLFGVQRLALAKKRRWAGLHACTAEIRQGLLFERFRVTTMQHQPAILLDLDPSVRLSPTAGASKTSEASCSGSVGAKGSGNFADEETASIKAEQPVSTLKAEQAGPENAAGRSRSTTRHRRHRHRAKGEGTSRSRRRQKDTSVRPSGGWPTGSRRFHNQARRRRRAS
jgi:hypothetical protein